MLYIIILLQNFTLTVTDMVRLSVGTGHHRFNHQKRLKMKFLRQKGRCVI